MNAHIPRGIRRLILLVILASLSSKPDAQSGSTLPTFDMRDVPVGLMLPGDFNRDGRVDLVGTPELSDIGPPTDLLVFFGIAAGGFGPPQSLGIAARPLAVADLNGDGRLDVVVRTASALGVISGSDGALRVIEHYGEYRPSVASFALVADLTGDGHVDIVVPYDEISPVGQQLRIHPGTGTFAFGTPERVDVEGYVIRGAVGDINNDGRLDLALARSNGPLLVLFSIGTTGYSQHDIVQFDRVGDVALADLNGDDFLDLIFSTSVEYTPGDEGEVVVRLGLGDGGFAPETRFESGRRNEYQLAVGDFTRDGIVDVATSNLSGRSDDNAGVQDWDSVSILRGDGTGALEPAVSFLLGRFPGSGEFSSQTHLQAADMDGDGHLDLLASPGTILFNRPLAANRAPVVFAGADFTVGPGDPLRLEGEAGDPDGHALTYRWTDASGRVIGTGPKLVLAVEPPPGPQAFTLTADDGHGGVSSHTVTVTYLSTEMYLSVSRPNELTRVREDEAFTIQWNGADNADRFDVEYSVDNGHSFDPVSGCMGLGPAVRRCVWHHPNPLTITGFVRVTATDFDGETAVALSMRFAIELSDTELPSGWHSQDIGGVARAGNAIGYESGWSVSGSGADIWGTADELHGLFTTAPSGPFEVTVRMREVENVDQWTKAGLMVRSHLGPSAAHASLFATPTTAKGVAFQRRRADSAASVHTAGPSTVAPLAEAGGDRQRLGSPGPGVRP